MKETDEKKGERMEWKATIIREFKEQWKQLWGIKERMKRIIGRWNGMDGNNCKRDVKKWKSAIIGEWKEQIKEYERMTGTDSSKDERMKCMATIIRGIRSER